MRWCRYAVVVVAGVIALAAQAAPALADGFSLNLAAQSQAVVGHSLLLQATGTIPPPGDIDIPYWFSLDVLNPSVTQTCPADAWEAVQFATTGGTVLVRRQRETADAAGNFSIPVAARPTGPGRVLLCAYTDDGMATTLAAASLTIDIKAAASSGSSSDRVSPPVQAQRAIRACRALLDGSGLRSCIRREVRDANARCRRLRSRPKRSSCLRAVRRVSART
jgi:hypothetical protein